MRLSYTDKKKLEGRRKSLSFLARFFLAVAAAIILTLSLTSFIDQEAEFDRLNRERQKLEAERDVLYLKYESLKGLDDMAQSREYIERLARDYLGMAMPGDLVFIVD